MRGVYCSKTATTTNIEGYARCRVKGADRWDWRTRMNFIVVYRAVLENQTLHPKPDSWKYPTALSLFNAAGSLVTALMSVGRWTFVAVHTAQLDPAAASDCSCLLRDRCSRTRRNQRRCYPLPDQALRLHLPRSANITSKGSGWSCRELKVSSTRASIIGTGGATPHETGLLPCRRQEGCRWNV